MRATLGGFMRSVVLAVTLCLSLACGSGGDEPQSTANHTLTIQNSGTNTVQCVARQFSRLTITPSSGGTAVEYAFVSSPTTSVDIPVTLPQTGTFDLRVYTPAGSSIWWNGLAMAAGGTTPVSLSTNNMGFYDNSYAAGLRSTGNDIPCQ